jgi:hypothetical protein
VADLQAIRAGIQANVATANPTIETSWFVRDSISPPHFIVGAPERIEFDVTIARGADRYLIPCRMYAARTDDEDGQTTLDGYLNSKSSTGIKTAVESDITLGGAASTVRVIEARDYGEYVIGNVSYYGVELLVEVITQ